MSDDPTITGEEGQSLAAEYVLGLLATKERQAAELRLAHDPDFAREVAFWEERLGALANEMAPVTPPERVWSRIDADLSRRRAPNLWNSLMFWRWSAIASAALAAASLAVVYVAVVSSPRGPLVATLDAGGQAGFVAAIDPDRHSLTIVPASLTRPDQRAFELWVIVPGDRPRSLGLIEAGRPIRVNVPPNLTPHMQVDAALAVSIEPPGGSPTGLPTGPVIASGKLTNL